MKIDLKSVRRYYLHLLIACPLISACKNDHKSNLYTIDETTSAIEWKGYLKDGSGNNGTIKVTGELFANDKNEIISGNISLPLSSLININLPNNEIKTQLIHHLRYPDFFNMAAHPKIGFKITSVTPNENQPGIYKATGELTIWGKTNPVSFPVKVSVFKNEITVTGETSIDRTLWGMTYATDENAGDGIYVKPGIDVQFELIAGKK